MVVRIDGAALERMLRAPEGLVARDLLRRANRVANTARLLCPVDTGRLRGSITAQLVETSVGPAAVVGTNVEYAQFVHDGTGMFGPHHTPIVPVRAKFLRWQPKGQKEFVYRRSVQGMPGRPFLRDALASAFI